jgi:hypothetical protein
VAVAVAAASAVASLGKERESESVIPRTCDSSDVMILTACWRMVSLVWGLSLTECTLTMRPSSLNASLMSRTRILHQPQQHQQHATTSTTTEMTKGWAEGDNNNNNNDDKRAGEWEGNKIQNGTSRAGAICNKE